MTTQKQSKEIEKEKTKILREIKEERQFHEGGDYLSWLSFGDDIEIQGMSKDDFDLLITQTVERAFEKGFKAGQKQLLDEFKKIINEFDKSPNRRFNFKGEQTDFVLSAKELKQKLNSLSKKEGVEE